MLPAAGNMRAGAGGARPELYRWRRQRAGGGGKPTFDYDNVEHWIKRVEEASEFAVSEVFSNKKPAHRTQRATRSALDLQTADQLHDHDDAYSEAQELLNEWLSNKLRLELGEQEDEEPSTAPAESTKPPAPEFIKYNRFDDLYQYLEHETEDTNTQDFLQQLLQKEVVDSGILENLRSEEGAKKAKQRDPRVTMEVRHQQVKENRARRQKELEKQKQERAMKKAALAQAQLLVQEENKHKTLKTKKEEEEIQREMVKLRKEMNERRRVMEEARKIEWKRRQQESKKVQETVHIQPAAQEMESERRTRERQAKIQELLSQVYADNHRCLQKYFSAWYKLVLDRRVKMGKARALADWKLQLRTFRAWRQHVWSQKLEQETQKIETELRDEKRKQKVAEETYHKRLLRHCLIEWQLWCRAEKEKKELEVRKEETKKKMEALLEAALSKGGHKQNCEGDETEGVIQSPKTAEQEGEESSSSTIRGSQTPAPHKTSLAPKTPKHAWQVTRQHAALAPAELNQQRLQPTPSPPALQRKGPIYGEHFENRHQFQQLLIDEQRRQLQEQKDMIQELMENQRLMIARGEAKNASATTAQLRGRAATRRKESGPLTDVEAPRRLSFSSQSEGPNGSPSRSTAPTERRASISSNPHPTVRAMEERAAQRAEKKRLLEELKRKREEDKLAQLRAAEEQRLQMEAAEREAQLQRKREERRLQKMKKEEKQRRLQSEKEHQELAVSHYKRALLRSHGLEPWKRLMAQCRQNMERAEPHHRSALLRRVLRAWSHAVTEIAAEKSRRAEQLCATILLRRSFRSWLKYKDYLSVQEERAQRRYKANLRRKIFMAWLELTQDAKIAMWEKQRSAAEHSQRRILRSAFRSWRQFPKRMKDLRIKEERLDSLRKKVAEILPDFQTGDTPL